MSGFGGARDLAGPCFQMALDVMNCQGGSRHGPGPHRMVDPIGGWVQQMAACGVPSGPFFVLT